MNNLNSSDGEKTRPSVVSNDEDDSEVVPEVPMVKKTVRILPDTEVGRTLKIVSDGDTCQILKLWKRRKLKIASM